MNQFWELKEKMGAKKQDLKSMPTMNVTVLCVAGIPKSSGQEIGSMRDQTATSGTNIVYTEVMYAQWNNVDIAVVCEQK